MSLQQIQDAAAAQNTLHDRINDFIDTIDDDITARQAAYAALSADLIGIVATQMNFTALWNPALANPTNKSGGTFASLAALVAAAPRGADIVVNVTAGTTVTLTEDVIMYNHRLRFERIGAGANPVVKFGVIIVGGLNYRNHILNIRGAGSLSFIGVDVDLPGKLTPAASWTTEKMFTSWTYGASPCFLRFENCIMTAAEAASVMQINTGSTVFFNAMQFTVNGPITILPDADTYISIVARYAVTLQNGAALYAGGTVGQNILLV